MERATDLLDVDMEEVRLEFLVVNSLGAHFNGRRGVALVGSNLADDRPLEEWVISNIRRWDIRIKGVHTGGKRRLFGVAVVVEVGGSKEDFAKAM